MYVNKVSSTCEISPGDLIAPVSCSTLKYTKGGENGVSRGFGMSLE